MHSIDPRICASFLVASKNKLSMNIGRTAHTIDYSRLGRFLRQRMVRGDNHWAHEHRNVAPEFQQDIASGAQYVSKMNINVIGIALCTCICFSMTIWNIVPSLFLFFFKKKFSSYKNFMKNGTLLNQTVKLEIPAMMVAIS